MRTAFRPDLEGLRGVAVALVVLFHARLLGVAGGFVGVDVFYVVSGFLITRLLVAELDTTGRVDLLAFYARRARRILPAATVAIAVILAVALVTVAPLDLPVTAMDATLSASFAGNIAFALRATDYFAPNAPSPFLHYWSLGVEEQFYLVWPLLIALASRLHRRRAIVLAVCLASFGLSLTLTEIVRPWAFYGLPTRAWQLAVGALLGTVPIGATARRAATSAAGWLGLAAIVVAALAFDGRIAYPGFASLFPTLGAAAVIAAAGDVCSVGRALAIAPLRFLGRISFSLYLYHWPVLVLADVAFGPLPAAARAALVVLSLVVATVSWAIVEEPFRRSVPLMRRPRRSLLLGVSGTTAVLVLAQLVGIAGASAVEAAEARAAATSVVESTPPPSPPSVTTPLIPEETAAVAAATAARSDPPTASPAAMPHELRPHLADARRDTDGLNERGCGLSLAGSVPPRCELGVAAGSITVALVGDSHAAQWFPAIEGIAVRHGWRILPFTKDSCIFVDMRIVSIHLEREYTECARWREAVIADLQRARPDLVIVSSSRWVHAVDPADADPARQAAAMARLLERLPGRVAVIADTPLGAQDVPACLSRRDRTWDDCATATWYALSGHLLRDGPASSAAGAYLIDPSSWLCDVRACPAVIDWTIVLRDDHHLTATMARRLTPLLEPAVLGALGRE